MVLATLNMLGMMITLYYTYDSMVDIDILLGQAFGVAQNVLTTSMATCLAT